MIKQVKLSGRRPMFWTLVVLIKRRVILGTLIYPFILSAEYFGGNGGQWGENVHDPMNTAQWSNHHWPTELRANDWHSYSSSHRCYYHCPGPHPYYNPYEYDSPYYNNYGAEGVYFELSR